MATSGGLGTNPGPRRGILTQKLLRIAAVILISLLPASDTAQEAKRQYSMDLRSDCIIAGFLDVPRGQVTYVQGRSMSTSLSNQQLSCYLQFTPQTEGDTLKMWFESGAYIEDCDVSLDIELNKDNRYTLGCRSSLSSIPKMEAINGRAVIKFTRKTFDIVGFSFQIGISAERSVAKESTEGTHNPNVWMIVGIVAGVIAVIVIAIVICVCCYRRKQNAERDRAKHDLTKGSPHVSLGVDNSALKNSFNESPGSDRKLLGKNSADIENGLKPKSALDRFGPLPSQKPQNDLYEEQQVADRNQKLYERRDVKRLPELARPSEVYEAREVKKEQPVSQSPPKSPLLAALHNNSRFRRSFHQNEADADERARRISGSFSQSSSSISVDSTGAPKPKLPPVPKSPPRSPSPQRRGEKIAGIFRARPSSSSEVAKFDEESTDGSDYRAKPSNVGKQDTRHALRPNRGERKVSERKPRKGRKSRRDEDSDSEDERRRQREGDRHDEEKQRRREEEEEEARRKKKEEERRQRKEEARRYEEEEEERQRKKQEQDKEYEGRFKKSASGRKLKAKGQKMARSKSTGNALEDEPSLQRTRSKSPSSVRSLNFVEDDDDDDDLDSNYMPFRRAGSKTSLYASRSSLYGRKRKNSMGETISLSSYAVDDVDSRMGDFDKNRMSQREKDRLFKSTGDLEMRPASAQVVRECGTWTGSDKGVYIYGRKTLAKGRLGKRYHRGTQTHSHRERKDSTGSARSGRSTKSNQRLKSKSRSQESLGRRRRSKSRDVSEEESISDRSRDYSDADRPRHRSKSRDLNNRDDYSDVGKRSRSKSKDLDKANESSSGLESKPKPKPRKSFGAGSIDLSNSDDDSKSVATSSVAPSSIYQPTQPVAYPPPQPMAYQPQFIPAGYPMAAYPQPAVPYVATAPGGPPTMVPVTTVPIPAVPLPVVMQKPTLAPKPMASAKPPAAAAPATKPTRSKWDELVNLTDGMKKRRRQMGESVTELTDHESVVSSMWSQPVYNGAQPCVNYAPPSYYSAQRLPNLSSSSAYPESAGALRSPRDSSYAASESHV